NTSYTTHSWPAFMRRRTMLAPMRPSPIIPSCMACPPGSSRSLVCAVVSRFSGARDGNRAGWAPVGRVPTRARNLRDMSGAGAAPTASVQTWKRAAAVTLSAGEIRATYLPELGMLGASLTVGGRETLVLRGGLEGYRSGHSTALPLLHP